MPQERPQSESFLSTSHFPTGLLPFSGWLCPGRPCMMLPCPAACPYKLLCLAAVQTSLQSVSCTLPALHCCIPRHCLPHACCCPSLLTCAARVYSLVLRSTALLPSHCHCVKSQEVKKKKKQLCLMHSPVNTHPFCHASLTCHVLTCRSSISYVAVAVSSTKS